MKHLLTASVLLCLVHLPTFATELDQDDLVSTGNRYLQPQADNHTSEATAVATLISEELHLEYTDQYDRLLITLGELDVERKITLNGGGKELTSEAFELGFHIAVNYTP